MKTKKALLIGITSAALALAITPPVTAQAVPRDSCHLLMVDEGSHGFVRITLTCAPRTAGDGMAVFKLYGSDTFSNELLITVETTKSVCSFTIHENYLNEDIGQDEVFAKSWFRRPNGSLYTITSNKQVDRWGFIWDGPQTEPWKRYPTTLRNRC